MADEAQPEVPAGPTVRVQCITERRPWVHVVGDASPRPLVEDEEVEIYDHPMLGADGRPSGRISDHLRKYRLCAIVGGKR